QDSLAKVEEARKNYLESQGLISPSAQIQGLVTSRTKLEDQEKEAQIELDKITQELAAEIDQVSQIDKTFSAEIAMGTPIYITQLQQELTDAELRKATIVAEDPQ